MHIYKQQKWLKTKNWEKLKTFIKLLGNQLNIRTGISFYIRIAKRFEKGNQTVG